MTILRNVTFTYNFDHKEGVDLEFDCISDLLLSTLSDECGLTVNSEEVFVNSTTTIPEEDTRYTSLRELYSQPEQTSPSTPYTPMRSLVQNSLPETGGYSRYTSQ